MRPVDRMAEGMPASLVRARTILVALEHPVAAGPRKIGEPGETHEHGVESGCAGLREANHKDPGLTHGPRRHFALSLVVSGDAAGYYGG